MRLTDWSTVFLLPKKGTKDMEQERHNRDQRKESAGATGYGIR